MGLINWASTSDQHLGAPRIAPGVIAENIRKVLFPVLNDDLDLLTFVGDFSDGLFEFGSTPSFESMRLIDDVIDLSIKHNFFIRILQGTFTHDRNQSKFFDFRTHKVPLLHGVQRIKYVDRVDIEHIEPLGLTILYKPDDLPHKDVFGQIKRLVKEVGRDIDIFMNHGYFEHLLPKGIPHRIPNTLKAEEVEAIVRGITVNGHVHTPSVYRRVINHGSFDRLCHGEEEPKGFFKITYDTVTKEATHAFIENTYATLFCTVDCSAYESDLDQCKEYVAKRVAHILENKHSTSDKVFIRIHCDDPTVKHAMFEYVRTSYDNVVVTLSAVKKKELDSTVSSEMEMRELPPITPNNVVSMVVEHTKERGTPLEEDYVRKKLNP